jgi:hypothetical protein
MPCTCQRPRYSRTCSSVSFCKLASRRRAFVASHGERQDHGQPPSSPSPSSRHSSQHQACSTNCSARSCRRASPTCHPRVLPRHDLPLCASPRRCERRSESPRRRAASSGSSPAVAIRPCCRSASMRGSGRPGCTSASPVLDSPGSSHVAWRYASLFVELPWRRILELDDKDLAVLGVATAGARRKRGSDAKLSLESQ